MHLLLQAIQNRQLVTFNHQKYSDDFITNRIAEPFALKESKNRWYLIAKEIGRDQIRSFGLDRISGIEIRKKKFELPPNFDTNEPFVNSFGISNTSGLEPDEIILSFHSEQGNYIKSLPLHHSQHILIENDEELRIRLRLCITHDFIMELMSYGNGVTVIAPLTLREDIIELHQKALNNYLGNPKN
jgi:predicted DNA-binding transcriptional regulator YafY